ncbi:MAG: hypothetical protein JW873_02015 [Candidatus Saganbacteria bacterium]|nr:hypothetical protein [Candidatus Saganbacteria bacterium]
MRFRPGLLIIFSFLALTAAGAALLALPLASSGAPTGWLDAAFTASSAACVTGLTTLDTGGHFSLFGLLVILALIQLGGLGYMTFATFIVLVFRQKLFIPEKLAFPEIINLYSPRDVLLVLGRIFGLVVLIEAVGALLLFLRWLPERGLWSALLWAVFHSVSAFNNAGFALTENFAGLRPYSGDVLVNLTVTTLAIIGGLGFLFMADVLKGRRLSLHTKVTLFTTVCLIIGGTLVFFALERHNPGTLAGMSLPHKVMVSYFQAVAPRTAGFSTVAPASLFPATALFTMLLMFIGAGSGGTGGGIKVTTFAVVLSTIWATLRGFKNTIIYNRRLPAEIVRRAVAIVFLSLFVVALALFILNGTEKAGVKALAFETFSAFSNVGLTLGLTPGLSPAGKLVIIAVMFLGRVGGLTLLLTLMMGQKEPKIEPPKEGVSIG